ncbi:MAG: phosphatidate cytidylyltransferase, partial [Bacilli bacterium]|nr:phosphatidate cytidylyltransferase [Bacilli bacterium]
FSANSGWYWVLIMSFTTPLLGVLGDFTFSMIKRHYGFKDFSHILGAHGGVLDRADSLIFTYAFAAVFAIFTSTGWRFWA